MAQSGSYNFVLNRQQMIETALSTLGVIEPGVTPDNDLMTYCSRKLNLMLKAWQADGLNLWRKRRLTLFPALNTHKYLLGPSATGDASHVTLEWDRTTNRTELSVAASSGTASVTVDSTSNMSASDNIGIQMDDGSLHWSTISSVDSTTTLTIAAGIDDDAAIDNDVYWYTNKAQRPLRVLPEHAWVTTAASGGERPLHVVSSEEFWKLSNKTSDGAPAEVYYDPQLSTGALYVFPEPAVLTEQINLVVEYPAQDLDVDDDDFDIPQEWLLAVELGLAELLAIPFGISGQPYKDLIVQAMREKYRVSTWDRESTSVYIRTREEEEMN